MRIKTLPTGSASSGQGGRQRPPFSVVVVTFNTERTNAKCLESVLRTIGPSDELIVVDNASTDSTPDYLRSLTDSRVRVVLNTENTGYSIGANQGLRLAEGEYVVMLNPDTQVPPRWLERMRAHFRDARVGAVGPVSDRAGGCQRFEFYLPAGMEGGYGVDDLGERIYAANAGKALEAKTLIGFCLMVSRRAMDAVGLLDEDLVLGNDDLEYCLRLREAGFKVLAATDVFVHHEQQVSFKSLPSERTRRMVQESTDALARKLVKHYGEGKVPSSRELFGVDWFKPSFDLWPGRFVPLSAFEKDAETGVFRHSEFDGAAQGEPASVGDVGRLGKRVLVLGNAGADLVRAAGESVVAINPSLAGCRAVRASAADVYCGDPGRVAFEEAFPAVLVVAGADLPVCLEAAARALEPGGKLVVVGVAGLGRREAMALLLPCGFDRIEVDGSTVRAIAGG